jgi:hypothetical protein
MCDYLSMAKRLLGIFIIVALISVPLQAKAAEDYLLSVDMNESTSWDSSNLLPKEAQLKKVRYQIPRENPDKLIAQILLKYPLAAKKTIPDSKWIIGLWLYAPSVYCYGSNNCNYLLEIQPSAGGLASIYKHKNKIDFDTRELSDCKTPWYLKTDAAGDSVVAFELSITCLNISSTFATYAFSSYDIGIDERPWQFTSPNYVDNPYVQIAEKTYIANGGKSGLGKGLTSPALESLKTSISKARTTFDDMTSKYDTLAPEIKKKLDKNKDWKNFLKLETQLVDFEDQVDNGSLSSADVALLIPKIIKLINSQISGLNATLKVIPKFQCYNENSDTTTVVNKSNTCPKGFSKIKT